MSSFYSLSNHVGSLTAQTVKAGAHGFLSPVISFVGGESAGVKAKLFFSDPSLFSAGRGYPHSSFARRVNNRKSPFSFKVLNITIGNHFRSERINNLDGGCTKNKLGLNPKGKYGHAKKCTQSQLDNGLHGVSSYKDAVGSKKNYQYISTAGPSKVTSGAKSFIHIPSIAGETK